MGKKSKYTAAQKKAYYSGMGYTIGSQGKFIHFKNKENAKSFMEGREAGKKVAGRYSYASGYKGKK